MPAGKGISERRTRSKYGHRQGDKIKEKSPPETTNSDTQPPASRDAGRGRPKQKTSNASASSSRTPKRKPRSSYNGASAKNQPSPPNASPPVPMSECPPGRISKRWIFVSVVLTLFFSSAFMTNWVNRKIVPIHLNRMREVLVENVLLKILPEGLFNDDFIANLTSILGPFQGSEFGLTGSPGSLLKERGAKVKHPVIIIPGVTSIGLELWEGKPCAKSYFRQRFWGSLSMLRLMLTDNSCWREHLKLNVTTGGDPDGIKLRPAQGLEAADILIPGYWIWARIIENLAEIGHDHNTLHLASYDWRLDLLALEERDHFYSKLKMQIELMVSTIGEKVVILTHSFGALNWLFFMKWVESCVDTPAIKGACAGRTWVDKHVHAIVNIAGPLLGLPKSIPVFVSGEMRDTVQLGRLESTVLETLMSKKERLSLFRSWPSGFAMFPKGGNAIWGDGKENADCPLEHLCKYPLITVVDSDGNSGNVEERGYKSHYYADDIREFLEKFMPLPMVDRLKASCNHWGIASPREIGGHDDIPSTWANPLAVRLPNAPKMRMYSFYGVKKPTERSYLYQLVPRDGAIEGMSPEEIVGAIRSDEAQAMILEMVIKDDGHNPSENMSHGVHDVDGDGSVPTISNGFMGAHAWRKYSHLNPSNITCINREYDHDPMPLMKDFRGGPRSSEHVDILGNHEMTMDILKIVTGFEEDQVQDKILSKIKEISARVKFTFE